MDEQQRYGMVVGVKYKPAFTGRVVLGLVMMAFGILWTLDNLGVLESGPILRWWPIVFLAIGIAKFLGIGTYRSVAAGAIFTLIGGWILAEQFDLIHLSFFMLWPVVLVVVGVAMVTRSARRTRDPSQADDRAANLSVLAFMSGVVRKVVSPEFHGGDITAMMGGVKLDLTGARPVPTGAVIDVVVCWGGIEITVPDTWRVVNEATVMLGGLEDRTKVPPSDARDTLILRGLVIMGGIEIKH
jgi:predicted membrane protein